MNFTQQLASLALSLTGRPGDPGMFKGAVIAFNNGVSLYPQDSGDLYIIKGYKRNATVYTVVSRSAEKLSQVPFYHYRLKVSERKTYQEAKILLKDHLHDPKARKEAKNMLTKAVDEVRVDSDLQKFLNRPNQTQTGAKFREQLYGFRLLTGEGNVWIPREEVKDTPVGMYIIPKSRLNLVGGSSPWDIAGYRIVLSGKDMPEAKENVIMWVSQGYDFDEITLRHLRGMAPLEAGLLKLQASNEAGERLVTMNKTQGVAGAAVRKDSHDMPTPAQAMFQRQQFDGIVNGSENAGKIAMLAGDWSFLQFGMDAGQLKLLEQTDISDSALCNLFKFPAGLLKTDQTYENAKTYERQWIYQNIAPACFSMRDDVYMPLVTQFGLDPSRDVIDCDILALPELKADLKEIGEATKSLWQLTPNQVLSMIGEEQSADPNMNKVYMPSGLRPMDDVNSEVGDNLNTELQSLEP